jgi:hypothetical protein
MNICDCLRFKQIFDLMQQLYRQNGQRKYLDLAECKLFLKTTDEAGRESEHFAELLRITGFGLRSAALAQRPSS